MSETGHPSEHCFLRLPQTEYYREKRDNDGTSNPLHTMPDVSMFTTLIKTQFHYHQHLSRISIEFFRTPS